jgi:hypothetical protein
VGDVFIDRLTGRAVLWDCLLLLNVLPDLNAKNRTAPDVLSALDVIRQLSSIFYLF